MATPARHLCRTLFQVGRQVPVKRKCPTNLLHRRRIVATSFRQLSTTPIRKADEITKGEAQQGEEPARKASQERGDVGDEEFENLDPSQMLRPQTRITAADFGPEERADFEVLSKPEQDRYLALQNHYAALLESAEPVDAMGSLVDKVHRQVRSSPDYLDFPNVALDRRDVGLWADDEEDEFGQVEDADGEGDESAITSVALSELEVHREVREYTRVVAWDMPLLQNFAKEFKPPTQATPLRFRYTTYMGEDHPAAKKVVVQFCTKDLPNLSDAQRVKLIKLLGPRYNPETDMAKMSCEKFEAAAQNKRYLGDLVNKLLDEARNAADMFEDIPMDLRHHKPKTRLRFPKEWTLGAKVAGEGRLLDQKVQSLSAARQKGEMLKETSPPALDGKEMVEAFVHSVSVNPLRARRSL